MIAAISPISGFMNLVPVMPVSLTGAVGASLAPTSLIGAALPDLGTIVSLAGAGSVPLTYTATGTFRTSVQITPGGPVIPTAGTAGTATRTRVHIDFDADIDLLIIRDRATAAAPLSLLPPDAISRLANAITTDLLLASLGSSSGTTANFASSMLSGIFGGSGLFGGSSAFGNNGIGLFNTNPLLGNTLNVNATTTPAVTTITGTATANLTLTIDTTPATAAAAIAPAPTATAVTAPLAVATPAVATPVTATPVVATTPTAAVAIAPTAAAAANPAGTAAADTTLQRFLTDAAARALDTVANNPTYAAAAASLYASVAVLRNQNEVTTLAAPGRDDAVRQINPTVAVQPLPSSVA